MSYDKKQVTKHPEYFFSDGDITIRVENHVFRIDKHFLTRHSAKLRLILDPIIPSRDRPPPGSSETNPAVLDEATSEEFASLLWVFYTPDFSYVAPFEKWKQILQLAHHWGIARVQNLCIRELKKLKIDPVEKIKLYQDLELNPNLLQSSFVELTIRPQPLSIEEGERLGIKTSMRLAQAREQARDPRQSISLQESDVEDVIEEVFGLQGSTPPSAAASPLKENPTTDDHVDKGGKHKKKSHGASRSFGF